MFNVSVATPSLPSLSLAPAVALPSHFVFNPQIAEPPLHSDLQTMANIRPELPQAGTLSASATHHFRKGVVECKPVPVEHFMRNALMDLLAPRDGCLNDCFPSNAKLREALAEILVLHPQGGETTLERVIQQLGVPSLLLDSPEYEPGNLAALAYDVGVHAAAQGLYSVSVGEPGEYELLDFGVSELRFLESDNDNRHDVARTHVAILDFHFGVAGMPGSGVRTGETPRITPAMLNLRDFHQHAFDCRRRQNDDSVETARAHLGQKIATGCLVP